MGLTPRLCLFVAALAASPAAAQSQGLVVRDGSLGDGPLEVGAGTDPLGQSATYLITPEMGEQRGSNLFHSFSSFGVATDETATFTGPDPIDGPQSVSNVISRVSGGNESQIDGTLRSTIPGADLFLINPSGVVFGEGATLDVPGSFHASTGDYLGFGTEGLERFYGDPLRQSVLSTAPPGAFGFLGDGPAAAISVEHATLSVHEGETLELVGGDVTLTGAELDASGETPGTIAIRGGRVVIAEDSRVLAENLGVGPGGRIEVAADESLSIDASLLSASTSGEGSAGTIRLEGGAPASSVELVHGGAIHNHSFGSGNAGIIEIDVAGRLSVDGADGLSSIGARSFREGAPGRIDIEAGSVELENGGRIDTNCGGCTSKVDDPDRPEGAGTIRIVADEMIVRGVGTGEFADSRVESSSYFGDGDAGAVDLKVTHSLQLLGGGSIHAQANGITNPGATSNAGDITIEAGSILISGAGQLTGGSGIYAWVINTLGHAGTVTIRADSLLTSFPAAGRSNTSGIYVQSSRSTGNAGSVDIEANSVVFAPGSGINAGADFDSTGNGGSVTIRADSLHIGPHPDFPRAPGRRQIPQSGINTSSFGPGKAGTIDVRATESIFVTYEGGPPFDLRLFLVGQALGAQAHLAGVFSATVGGGDGGSISLSAPDITVTEGAIVTTSTVGGGRGGAVELSGERISIHNGAIVDSTSLFDSLAGTSGGDAGSVALRATESIEVAGRRRVIRRGVEVEDWSRVSSASLGSGAAGTVTLVAPHILVDGGAVATTAVPDEGDNEGERGGEIVLDAEALIVRGGGRIDASTFIPGPGGRIDVTASESIVVEGEGSGLASRTGGSGTGGDVTLHAPVIEVADGGEIAGRSEAGLGEVGEIFREVGAAPSVATGPAGSVTLAADKLKLSGGTIATNAEDADGGRITIQAKQLVHLDAGVITATVTGATGGDISIDPDVVILQNGSRIEAQAGSGQGGHISITADNYFAFPGSIVSATAGNPEFSGTVEVNAPDTDIAGTLSALPASYLDASSLMRERCAARRSGERAGSFAVRGNGGIPAEPDGWLPGTLGFEAAAKTGGRTTSAALASASPAAAPGPLLGTCR